MRGSWCALAVVLGAMLAREAPTRAADASLDAAADARPSSLTKDDICRLTLLAANAQYGTPPKSATLLSQPATIELAGDRGHVLMDVVVSDTSRAWRPLSRGETCGDARLVEACEPSLGERCSPDGRVRWHWKVGVSLSIAGPGRVDSAAFLFEPPRRHKHSVSATMSPVPTFQGRFEWRDGAWVAMGPATFPQRRDAGPLTR